MGELVDFAGMQDPDFVRNAFAKIASRYVQTNHVLSLGIDILWRKRVAQIVEGWRPRDLLDLATGTGDLALAMREVLPETKITGADFCEPMLEVARQRGLENLVVADGMNLQFADASYDVLTVAFGLRNMADWDKALREMRRVLRPKGHLLVLDFSLPTGLLREPYRFYLNRVMPRIAGALTGEPGAYDYLAGSIERFPSGDAMCRKLESCGFGNAHAEPLNAGIASIYTADCV